MLSAGVWNTLHMLFLSKLSVLKLDLEASQIRVAAFAVKHRVPYTSSWVHFGLQHAQPYSTAI